MKFDFTSRIIRNGLDSDKPTGFNLTCKTNQKKKRLSVYKDEEYAELVKNNKRKLPTKGYTRTWKLPFNIIVEFTNTNRISHLVGFPTNWDIDDILTSLEEIYDEIAIGALKYELGGYSWTDNNENEKLYKRLIRQLSGQDAMKVVLSKDEENHKTEVYAKMFDSESLILEFCHCDICEDISKREEIARKYNENLKTTARKDFLKALPKLWD